MSAAAQPGPAFCLRHQHPTDMLTNAAHVTRFLAEMAPHLDSGGRDSGISEDAANGLYLILNAVEDTIHEAINRL